MTRHSISFDDGDLDQFDPHTREALMRLARQGGQKKPPPPELTPRTPLRVIETRSSRGQESEGFRYAQDGSIVASSLIRDPSNRKTP